MTKAKGKKKQSVTTGKKTAESQSAQTAKYAVEDRHAITLKIDPDKHRGQQAAEFATSETLLGSILWNKFSGVSDSAETNINDVIQTIRNKADAVNGGNLHGLESMLTAQAHALDAMFADLALKARRNMGEYTDAGMKYMNLALKAQSNCRTTIETIAEIKNPRPYIQNNRAEYQQVNNGTQPRAHPPEKQKTTNELLEDQSHEWMDTRAAGTASGDDRQMEAVGAIDGT